MKQAVLTAPNKIDLTETSEPKLKSPEDVLIQIRSVGVCGSDIHYYKHGRIGDQIIDFPFRVGHECSGQIVEIASSVNELKIGDRVAIDPLVSCGKCSECLKGRFHTCLNQKFLGCPGQIEGALAEYITMPAECCYKIPGVLSYDQGVLAEPLSIGLHAVGFMNFNNVSSIAILGSGPIGLSVMLSAKAKGINKIFVTDLIDERLKIANEHGAAYTGNPEQNDIITDIFDIEPGGVSVVFDCCGMQSAIDQSIKLLKPGGQLILVGIPEVDTVIFNPHLMRRKEISINNVRRQNGKMQEAINLMSERKITNDFMITHNFPLTKTWEAFELVEHHKDGVIKAMINF